jgi:ADP-heptose:LPS heptosyltransferase
MRFLVLRLSSFGDLLRFLPLAKSLKGRYPGCSVDWVVADRYATLLALSPHVDRVIPLRMQDRCPWLPRPAAVFRRLISARRERFDAVIDAHCSHWTNLLALATRATHRVSIDRVNVWGARPLKYLPLEKIPAREPADFFLSPLDLLDVPRKELDLDLRIDPVDMAHVGRLFSRHPRIVLHPGSSKEFKNWPESHYLELVRQLNSDVAIVGSRAETRAFAHLAHVASDLSFGQLAALLSRAQLFVGNDSGPLHLAAAVGTATIGLFGPSDPRIHTPYGNRHTTVRLDAACSPCFDGFRCADECHTGTRECLRDLPVQRVLDAVRARLAG